MADADELVGMDRVTAMGAVRHMSLLPSFEAAGAARRLLRELAQAVGQDGWLDTAELACTELVTNAVLHAHTSIEVVAHATAAELVVEVSDRSPVLPVQRSYDSYSTTGRGMALVAALVSDFGVRDAGPGGKTAWFVVRADHVDDRDEAELLSAWDDPDAEGGWEAGGTGAMTAPPDTSGSDVQTADERGPWADGSGVWVRLLGLPPTLWLAAQEHHDAILREMALYLAQEEAAGVDLISTDLARSCVFAAVRDALDRARRARAVGSALPPGHPTPLPLVPEPFDLDMFVPSTTAACFAAMQDTLDAAERLAVSARLLARPGLPEVVAVRDWVCEQVIAQHGGTPAKPWPGTDHERFTADVSTALDVSDWDLEAVRSSGLPVVAADDGNRIVEVSEPLARLVGWDVDALVGRRIVTLIPPRLREAHVAGFTRHLTTGTSLILGVPLTLPVLRADGTEIVCRVVIDAVPAHRGRRYLAHITPAEPDGPPQG